MSFRILCLVVLAGASLYPGKAAEIFNTNGLWRFFRGTNEASPGAITAWRTNGFSDAEFTDRAAPFWYGDALPGGTELTDMRYNYSCIFLRRSFVLSNASEIAAWRWGARVDDGYVAWINGHEIHRVNMPDPPFSPVTRTTLASNAVIDPAPFVFYDLPVTNNYLINGINLFAVQVFNTAVDSSDLGFDCSIESIVSETVPPVVTAVQPAPGSTVNSLTQVTVTFSEPVQGVNADDLLINAQPAASFTGDGTIYTFFFAQPLYGHVSFTWFPTHGIVDRAASPNPFDANGPNATWQYTLVDIVPPAVASLFPTAGVTLRSLSEVEVTFSEEVNGVDAADLFVNNQPATNVNRLPGGPYVFQFPSQPPGTVNLRWADGHGITDQAMPPNPFVGGPWSYYLDPNAQLGDLVINEILASNQNGLADEFGELEDWIEIYNRGTNALDLAGWSLSDEPAVPSRWIFPSVLLPAHHYLVVFASGKDRRTPGGTNRLHTNFQLSSRGEFLGLYNADAPRGLVSSFSPGYPEQRNDISYGRDGRGNLRYFSTPSPGTHNGYSALTGVVEPVHFSVSRGFYTQPFDLILTCPTPGATIRYTTDGSVPTAVNGSVYVSPWTLTRTANIRAAAFRTNLLPSIVTTHSYLFNFSAAQRSVPVINLVTATNNLIGRTGIIGMGGGSRAGDGLFITNNPATDFHNPSMHGIAWERPVSVEYIVPQDNSGFQIDAGLRVHGSDWQRPRTTPTSKFSFRLYFRGDYGAGELNYPLFPLATVDTFDQVVLRAGFNEQGNPFIRDEVTRRLSHDMGQVAALGSMALVLLDGGPFTNNASLVQVYNPTERVTKEFMQSHLGGGPEWDVVAPSFAVSATGLGVIDGDRNDFNNLMTNFWSGSAVRPITDPAAYLRVARRLDLVNFVDYCLLNAYVAMGDWPANNWRAARERATNAIWRYVAWDCEWAMGIYSLAVTRDSFAFAGTGTEDAGLASVVNSEIARTYQALRPNREFRLLWADRIQKHFFNGGALTGANISNRFDQLRLELLGYLPSMDTEILAWARDRLPIIMGQFNTYGLYGFSNSLYGVFASSNAPSFNQHGGPVAPGFALTLSAPLPGSLIYYTTNGDDPRVMFTGAVSNSAVAYTAPLTLSQTTRVRARSLWNDTNWSALTEATFDLARPGVPLRITEIHYHPLDSTAYEFIEIQNLGSTPIDMGGMTLEGVDYTFPHAFTIAAGARIVLATDFDPAAFAARYPGVAVAGYFGGALNNAGERIALRARNGDYIVSVDYDDAGGWPLTADGGGYSLEIIDPDGHPDDPANWRASDQLHGTPGAAPTASPTPAVRINEIMALNLTAVNHGGTFPDWVELHNPTATNVDLSGWSLSDDGNARKFVFPSGVMLNAGAYLVVWCDDPTNTTPGLHTGFALSQNADNVYLFDAATNRVDAVSFGSQLADYSVGRVGGEWVLATPTTNAVNVAAAVAAPTMLSINEWLANPLPGMGDWLELYNAAAQPVALRGLYLSTGTNAQPLSSLSFIAPAGFRVFQADEGVGFDHLDLKLSATGSVIVLSSPLGIELNRVSYSAQTENVSRGRLPDGSANIVNFPGSASPGASNYLNTYTGPVIHEVLARNVSAVTNSGQAADFVEIYNPGPGVFAMDTLSVSVNQPEAGQWRFPTGYTLSAGGYAVIWCDGARPASTNVGNFNTGRALDGDSGGVYLFSAVGQLLNSIEYGPQVENLPIGLSGGQWQLVVRATPGAPNAPAATTGPASHLRLNEWMALPLRGPDWFELFNGTNLPVALAGLYLTDDPSTAGQGKHRIAPLSFIGPLGFTRFIADNDPEQGRHHVNFALDDDGDLLRLNNTNFVLINSVSFGAQSRDVSQGRLLDGQINIVSFPGSPTPAAPNYQLLPTIVVNEALTHTDAPLEDAIELHHFGSEPISLGGWYLSNSRERLKKFRLPDGTVIAGGGFQVIYQYQFNDGSSNAFTLNATYGDSVWLSEADANGNLTGRRTGASFGPAANGVSFGRFATSQGVDYPALGARTFGVDNPSTLAQFRLGTGLTNAAPQVGPVVINEIMYHPREDTNTPSEYLELKNVTAAPVSLFDPAAPNNTWRLRDGVEFAFPTNTILAAGGLLLVVDFNPASLPLLQAFRTRYAVPSNVPVLGPFTGKLDNAGETIELAQPDRPQPPGAPDAGYVPYLVADRIAYGDESPWPSGAADGGGWSLQRRVATTYGNEPTNWLAALPTPGLDNGSGTIPAPSIVAAPQPLSVFEGSPATFSVTASGTGPLDFQWRYHGVPLLDATNSSLVLDYAILEQAGLYDVVVRNPGGSAVSPAVALQVRLAPLLLVPLTGVATRPGSNVTFTASAVRGTPPIRHQWRFGGTNLPGETNLSLLRTNVQLADDGIYELVLSNPVGTTVVPVSLTVLVNPVIVQGPIAQTVAAGETVVLSVEATGNPLPFTYEWRRGSTILSTNLSYQTIDFFTFRATNTAQYRAVVKNQALFTPGVASPLVTITVLADSDGDGLPDAWETQAGLSPTNALDALADLDGDGMSNRAEYVAGTEATNAASYLWVDQLTVPGSAAVLVPAISNKTYTVQFSDQVTGGPWQKLGDIVARTNNRLETISDPTWTSNRFYRVVTPAQP